MQYYSIFYILKFCFVLILRMLHNFNFDLNLLIDLKCKAASWF